MSLKLLSDLHMEFSDLDLSPSDTDQDDILILAGDIGVVNDPKTFDKVVEWSQRFQHVIQVMGNHEFYHGSLIRAKQKLLDKLGHLSNWTLLDNTLVRINDVSFVGGTLWTDFHKGDPIAKQAIQYGLNDYNYIRTGSSSNDPYTRKITPLDISIEHDITRKFIFDNIVEEKNNGQKVVVVTHHAPSTMSIDFSRYGHDVINWAYASDLSNEILDSCPNVWVHGHVHSSFDYVIGDTRIVTNPRGYCRKNSFPENTNFNPAIRIDV
jgi:Icc-related predicted phosphoesterase